MWICSQGRDSDGVVMEGQCSVWESRCHGEKSQSGHRALEYTLPVTNQHQCGSNQLWCWRKVEGKIPTPTRIPSERRPYVFPPVFIHASPRVSGGDCSFGEMNNQTWLVWAKRQRLTCQWSSQLARHKTPQHPSQTSFSFCFPFLPQNGEILILLFFFCYQSGYKHSHSSCCLYHKMSTMRNIFELIYGFKRSLFLPGIPP